jgi:uncharacterized protein YbaR (Trm112 family)
MNLDEALAKVLACPRCGGHLTATASDSERSIRCEKCRVTYPVKDNVLDFLSPLDHKSDP